MIKHNKQSGLQQRAGLFFVLFFYIVEAENPAILIASISAFSDAPALFRREAEHFDSARLINFKAFIIALDPSLHTATIIANGHCSCYGHNGGNSRVHSENLSGQHKVAHNSLNLEL